MPFFSIVTISLNPGKDLAKTVQSVLDQNIDDWELIIQDGLSSDNSLESLPEDDRLHLYQESDQGVFDAMNRAVQRCHGQWIQFLNCGDTLPQPTVLESVKRQIQASSKINFFYGNVHKPHSRAGVTLYPSRLSKGFVYDRMVCQQAWFVERNLAQKYSFTTESRIGGDDIWLKERVARNEMTTQRLPEVVVAYRGGGLSEQSDLQLESQAFRDAARRRLYSVPERIFLNVRGDARKIFKSLIYDPFLWRLVRRRRRKHVK